MVNRRALRTLDVGTFKERTQKAKTLREAMDDGFEDYTDGEDRRNELNGLEMLIIGWQLRTRGSGSETARVWALVQSDTGDVLKVKFYAAGQGNIEHPGIPVTLRDMEDNGVTGDVRVRFGHERYTFFGADGTEGEGDRFWIEDIDPEDEAARTNAADDKPDF